MSEWTPKVGDKVMVGEHGPYEVDMTAGAGQMVGLAAGAEVMRMWVPIAWLTPAPEPEPDEPTVPGALVRDGAGRYLTRGGMAAGRWYGPSVQGYTWAYIERPITVILADPAEVEQLRDQVAALRDSRDALRDRADELQRRINRALALTGPSDKLYDTWLTQGAILRGES